MKWYGQLLIAVGASVIIMSLPYLREQAHNVSANFKGRDIPAGYGDEDKEPIGGAKQQIWGHWLGNKELFQAERTKGAETGGFTYNEDNADFSRGQYQQAWTRHQASEFLFEPDRPSQREFQQLKERDRGAEKELEKQEKDRNKQRKPFPVKEWYEKLFSGVGAFGAFGLEQFFIP